MPSHLSTPTGQPSATRTGHRRSLRTLVVVGLALGVLAPATAVRAEPSQAEIQQRISRESAKLVKVVEQYNKVNEELKTTKAKVEQHAKGLPQLEGKLAEARSDVSEIAATAYKRGQLREVDAVLATDGQDALIDRLGSLEHLARGRQAQITSFTAARQQYDGEKRRLDTALAKQKIQMRDLKGRKTRIEADLERLNDMRREAYGTEQESGSSYSGTIPSLSGAAGQAVTYAYNAIGTPYAWGGEGPGGYDCSGLTLAAWRAAGKSLPHNTDMQWNQVAHIDRSAVRGGDLVFYPGHVALAVGNGQIIHAPTFGETVKLADMDVMSPTGYGRVR